jgi:hypothetical protein
VSAAAIPAAPAAGSRQVVQSLFDEEPRGVTGSGFAIRKGHWRWRSGTFNSWLPAGMQAAMMDDKEQVFVKVRC